MEENKVLSIEVVRGIKEQLEAEIFNMISIVEDRTGCRIETIDIQRSFIQAGENELGLDTKVKVTMRI